MDVVPVHIKEPIWKDQSVGIADDKLRGDSIIYLTVGYKDRDGNKVFPYTYTMKTTEARMYPSTRMGNKTGRKIPIKDFEVL